MGKKKKGPAWYAITGKNQGVYYGTWEEVAPLVQGVSGALARRFAKKREAQEFLREMGLEGKERALPSLLRAYTDGSLRKGGASASAVVEGKLLAQGEIFLSWGEDLLEAEARAILLAILLTPSGGRLRVHTDRKDIATLAREGRLGEAKHPSLRAIPALASALEVGLEIVWVPRREVKPAHEGAREGFLNGERRQTLSALISRFLEEIPPEYRFSALRLLQGYAERVGSKEGLLRALSRGNSPTREHLRKALSRRSEGQVGELLKALRNLPPSGHKAIGDMDRERVWASKPPTPAQISFLESLGYQGPPPQSLLEASQKIEELLAKRRWNGSNNGVYQNGPA